MPAQTTIQVRRGTASSWTSTNPTLAAGEVGFETDTGKFKIGTGSAVWTSLSYFNPGNTSPLTTKGDLYTYSTTDARLAVGSNGQTLVADSSQTTGLAWANNFAAGKNKIINGDFSIWQRGTSFAAANNIFTADRWYFTNSVNPTSGTLSQQTFTAGTAPVAGYEGQFFHRYAITTVGSATDYYWGQKIEDVRTFANQTVTVSFWAKADTTRTVLVTAQQNFGTGGSTAVGTTLISTVNLTTSWQRFTGTATIPSISGKTIGAGNNLQVFISPISALANGYTLDVWGFQLEAGSVATAFQTATGTIQGELAACQRYYWRQVGNANTNYSTVGGVGMGKSTTVALVVTQSPVEMRIRPTSIDYANISLYDGTNLTTVTSAAMSNDVQNQKFCTAEFTVASGLTQYRPYTVFTNTTTGYLGFSAEL